MPTSRVYSAEESDGKLRPVRDAVYIETPENCADTRNHNPRVGGSSPSSATIFRHFSDGDQSSLQTAVNCPDIYPNLATLPASVPEGTPRYRLCPDGFLLACYFDDGTLISVQDMRTGKVVYSIGEQIPDFGPRADSSVYFIQAENGPVKIGMARDVYERFKTLQTASPVTLTILAVTNGGRPVEREYHKRFSSARMRGEWFEPHRDILAEIERLTNIKHSHGVLRDGR